jgi:hypothetical protein
LKAAQQELAGAQEMVRRADAALTQAMQRALVAQGKVEGVKAAIAAYGDQ